jgi:hypothetical protein
MGGHIAAVILAGPSDALTATATYPVVGANGAVVLRQRLIGSDGWATVTALGATLIALDAGGSDGAAVSWSGWRWRWRPGQRWRWKGLSRRVMVGLRRTP